MMIEVMRTTLDIDDDLLHATKEIARASGKTAGEVVSDLLRKALQPPAAKAAVRNGVPLIRRRAEAPPLTTALVNELRDAG